MKLSDYCLDPTHENGKHKARVFASALGLTQKDASWLGGKFLQAVYGEAQHTGSSSFGELYVIDFELTTPVGTEPCAVGGLS